MSNPVDPYNPEEVPSGQVAPRLADLLDAVQYHGKTFVITRRGKPVAQLTPVTDAAAVLAVLDAMVAASPDAAAVQAVLDAIEAVRTDADAPGPDAGES